MKDAFYQNALYCCGAPLLIFPDVPLTAQERQIGQWYYFFSLSTLMRRMANEGTLSLITESSTPIPYTHRNRTGKLPTQDATIVYACFSKRPRETPISVDRRASLFARQRRGQKRQAPLLDKPAKAARAPRHTLRSSNGPNS